jgi:ketosteroid isomerase-like protein
MGGIVSNVEVLRDLYEAFGRGDIPAVLGAMDPEIEWREAESNPYEPSGTPWIGPDAIVENLFMKLGAEWEVFTVQPKEFHDAGETVAVEGRYVGTYKSTGKSLDAQFCHVFKVRDGKVRSFQQFVDTAQLQDVMGASSRSGPAGES